jgi:hypothetical protein
MDVDRPASLGERGRRDQSGDTGARNFCMWHVRDSNFDDMLQIVYEMSMTQNNGNVDILHLHR